MEINIPNDKSNLRKHYLAHRRAITPQDQAIHAAAFAATYSAYTFIPSSNIVVAGYHPTKSELDVMPLLAQLGVKGITTALPCVDADSRILKFRCWKLEDSLIQGAYGIYEPTLEAALTTPDIFIVPLSAFDRAGHRLGYGGGYYDSTLKHLRAQGKVLAIGAAFSLQEHPKLPFEPHDEKLDYVVTEKEVIKIP